MAKTNTASSACAAGQSVRATSTAWKLIPARTPAITIDARLAMAAGPGSRASVCESPREISPAALRRMRVRNNRRHAVTATVEGTSASSASGPSHAHARSPGRTIMAASCRGCSARIATASESTGQPDRLPVTYLPTGPAGGPGRYLDSHPVRNVWNTRAAWPSPSPDAPAMKCHPSASRPTCASKSTDANANQGSRHDTPGSQLLTAPTVATTTAVPMPLRTRTTTQFLLSFTRRPESPPRARPPAG